MENFVAYNPTSVHFGKEVVKELGKTAFSLGKRVLLVYGKGSVMRNDRTALEQLEIWKTYQLYWCEHKPSITVYVKEEEWMTVGAWVYENFDIISGVSFLPHSDHNYQQAPYQEIDEETYKKLVKELPTIDWEGLTKFEKYDTTTGVQTSACSGGSCEIVDI